MADYTNSKSGMSSNYPSQAIDAQDWSGYEPVITADQLRRRFLFSIPLMSLIINPVTKKFDVMTDDDLRDRILRVIPEVSLDIGIDIFPVKRAEVHPFDRNLLINYGYFKLEHKPIASVDKLAVRPGNGQDIYVVPNEWIGTGFFAKGQINIIPLVPAFSNPLVNNAGGGAIFLQIVNGFGWIPHFWVVEYTTGFLDGRIPRIINELIGIYAAKEVLSEMAATNRNSSHSLGMDGMSQSVSTPGPQVYDTRLKYLEDRRQKIVGKIKALYGTKFAMGNI